MTPEQALLDSLRDSRSAAQRLRTLSPENKNRVLLNLAQTLEDPRAQNEILSSNAEDMKSIGGEAPAAFRDRLFLDPRRISQMAESLRQVAALPDPVGEITEQRTLGNGLKIRRVRGPLGVIFMIFESRPNVAIEAFSLAFKSGNAILLRGGKESGRSVSVLYKLIRSALEATGVDPACLWGITSPDRAISTFLLRQSAFIDVVVPRGGDALIEYVMKNSEIPVIKNDRGLCHVYVHEDADLEMAAAVVENAKTQRPGVCNAMETLLVHESVADKFLPALHRALEARSVQWFACRKSARILGSGSDVHAALEESWDTEYLDLKLNCKIVPSLEEAIAHIERHGSRHSESIITASADSARKFQSDVDAAAVYWNASTRFTDGFEFGLGGELGISTQKLHVRGPVGLRELTSTRWIIDGTGQTRN